MGIIVGDYLKLTGHVDRVVGKVGRILKSMLKRTFVSRDLGLWKDLYVFLVTPHLEYVVHA